MTQQSSPYRCPIRPEVLAFAMRMEMALRKHDKDRGNSYKESDSDFLIRRLSEEVTELEEAIGRFEDVPWPQKSYLIADPVVAVLSEGADVGNFAMMISYIAYPSEKSVMDYICAWNLPCTNHSAIQQPGQQGITVGMVYAYESGLEEGKKGALTDLLENFRKINKEGNFRPWNIGHIEDVILEELRKAGVNR